MIQDLMLVLQPATLYCLNSRLRMLLCGVYCCMHNVLHNVYSLCTARTTASCHLRSQRNWVSFSELPTLPQICKRKLSFKFTEII